MERQDLLDFATECLKKGQKGKSVYNKLVVISQVMKQHGKAKLLNTADWHRAERWPQAPEAVPDFSGIILWANVKVTEPNHFHPRKH